MKKTVVLILLLLSFFSFQIAAAPASRDLRTEELPDDTSISYFVNGDERYHYILSTDGYVLMKNDAGFYTYAQKDERNFLVAGNIIAHNEGDRTSEEIRFLKTITPFMEYHPDQIAEYSRGVKREGSPDRSSFSVFSEGNTNPNAQKHNKNIVILVEFSDLSFTVENPQATFSNFLNKEGYDYNGATGSVRNYFIESSFRAFQPSFDAVGPYRLPNPMSYYVSNPRNMVRDACQAADADVNFQKYSTDGIFVDNVCIIFAGYNSADGPTGTLWPHYSNLGNHYTVHDGKIIFDYICTSELRGFPPQAEICGIGTFVHEFSHILGLPDFYYIVGNQTYTYLDRWSVMDGGFYLNRGRTPAAYSAYERFFMGWLTPEILDESVANIKLYNLIDNNEAFIIATETPDLNGYNPSPNEFFLIENRQKKGFDAYLPHHGMLVWHIDYNQAAWRSVPSTVNTNDHQRVYLVKASGTQINSPALPFPGTTGRTDYSPTLWSGTDLNKPLYCIEEKSGIIRFNFIDGDCTVSLNSPNNDVINIWSGNKTLYISGIEEKTQVEILQIDGKIVAEKLLADSHNEIYIPKAGLYMVRLKSKNASFVYKVIIQ